MRLIPLESTTHSQQMLYIEAFSNLKIDNVLDFLEPIVTDRTRSRHIRLLAIWAAKSATTAHPEKVCIHLIISVHSAIGMVFI